MPSNEADHLSEILQKRDLSPEHEIRVLEMLEERRKIDTSREIDAQSAANQKWYNSNFAQTAFGSIAGFAAAIGTVFAAYVSGAFSVQEATVVGQTTITDRQLQNEFSTFEKLISINPDDLQASGGGSRDEERQRRVCMAITFGLIRVEPAILGVSGDDGPQSYSTKLSDFMDDAFECSAVGYLPKTLGTPFDVWANDLNENFRERGLTENQIQQISPFIQLDEKLVEARRSLDSNGGAVPRDYLKLVLSDERISLGKQRIEEFKDTLLRIDEEYKIPAELLVAIWGIESSYGENLGDVHVMTALANMAYSDERQLFFELQINSIADMISDGTISIDNLRGSWSGAMGHLQFLPTTFATYGVDFDIDGFRNPNSVADALASGANYLSKTGGWNNDYSWGYFVEAVGEFDAFGLETEQTYSELVAQGILFDAENLPPSDTMMSVIQVGNEDPLYFAVTQNFRTIRRFNLSSSYAVGVGLLSELVAGGRENLPSWLE